MFHRMSLLCVVFLLFVTKECNSQDEEGPYKGKFVGKLNSYHHQVSGDVYVVDEKTLLLVNFNYDGTGDDTFFWAGDSGRPGPQGFIIPDENGKTNVLERYQSSEVRLSLVKPVSRLRWFAVWDIGGQQAFADVLFPDDLVAPAPLVLPPLSGPGVGSKPIVIEDARTIFIPDFHLDDPGEDELYFWCGVGPQPSAKGTKIPDEDGYYEPLVAYSGSDVRLRLPGTLTVFDISWLAVWSVGGDRGAGGAKASVLLPDQPDVPPASVLELDYRSQLPRCRQLHRSLQVSWEIFGDQITIQLAALMNKTEYAAFGVSVGGSRMLGSDPTAVWIDFAGRPVARDLNVSAHANCVSVLGQMRGVCADSELGHVDNAQPLAARWADGLAVIDYRKPVTPADSIDLEWSTSKAVWVVWALGSLVDGAVGYHHTYPKRDVAFNLTADVRENDCLPFVKENRVPAAGWPTSQLDPALRVYTATVGVRARRGYTPLQWYMNGWPSADLQLRRGLVYSIAVRGGSDPRSPEHYHPLVVKTAAGHILAGAAGTRRGRWAPLAAGGLCLGTCHAPCDVRRSSRFPSFRSFNRTLQWRCPTVSGNDAAELSLAPNTSWPDVVYYDSFTQPGMGGRIFIVDRSRKLRKGAATRFGSCTITVLVGMALCIVTTWLV